MNNLKSGVHDFWNEASCGEDLYLKGETVVDYGKQSEERYKLEPYILEFAKFENWSGCQVLEIGVGLGADHQRFAEHGAWLFGIDLTERAIEHTSRRLSLFGLNSQLQVGDAESLPFRNNEFDLVYSWGVIHHSPNTDQAVSEILRVLKPGGEARVMIYNKWSCVGVMLWLRYGLLSLKPWTKMEEIYSKYLESPGTKAYTPQSAALLFSEFDKVSIETVLTHGDLLTSSAGQRHRGLLLNIARKIWPRWLIKMVFPKAGLFMLIKASKPIEANPTKP